MWDMITGRSRGYGFVSFKDEVDAKNALETMDGKWIGSRPIRLNWAQQKVGGSGSVGGGGYQQAQGHHYHSHHSQQLFNNHNIGNGIGGAGYGSNSRNTGGQPQGQNAVPMSYDMVLHATPNWQTTVYVGNLTPFTPPNDLLSVLQSFGYIVDFKYQPERGYAFVKFDNHERAAMAIVQLSGYQINGRLLKCGWGKDRNNSHNNYQPYRQY